MSDSENKTGLWKPSTELIEDEENYQVQTFETETSGDGKVPNMPLADLVPETTGTSDFPYGEPPSREQKLTEKGRAYLMEQLCQNVKTHTLPY